MRNRWTAWILAAALLSPSALADTSVNTTTVESGKGAAEATAQLKVAWQIKRTSFKKDPTEKLRILKEAIQAYEKIPASWPDARKQCCEALFRVGEIYRGLHEDGAAEASFKKCLDYKENAKFRARALLELGHARRRVKDVGEAVAFYERVIAEHADERKEASQAHSWKGSTLLRMGNAANGAKVLLDFEALYPDFPEAAIRNIDKVAVWMIADGKVNEAAEMIDACRARFTEKASGDKSLAAKVQRTLNKMKAPTKLALARSKQDEGASEGGGGK